MEAYNEDQFSGKALDHLGLVADKIDDLGIISFIDDKMPLSTSSGVKTTMGERVAAMILNGLGFVDTRLYLFPEFLEKKPVERLFGKELDANWFNDDALGRCLDEIANYGTTKLFTELSFMIGIKKDLLGRSAHFDTSTLQLYGEYPDSEEPQIHTNDSNSANEPPLPARGYSKSHRHDLKQMVINLATTGKASFPVWMESHSGNASDKKILPESVVRMNEFCKQFDDVPDFLYVGDSAMYSNILKYSEDMKWLSRVPENILEAKQLVLSENSVLDWQSLGEGYSYHVTESTYENVKQRWVLVFSEQAHKREIKTLERDIGKELGKLEKEWWHLGNELFSCSKDAEQSAKQLAKKMKYHRVESEIVEVRGFNRAGRPAKGAQAQMKGYKVKYTLAADKEAIKEAKIKKGRFILSTKDLLPDSEILQEYKAQSGTERGFKFIKDSSFEVDSVYLKTPSRIDALMMIMTLCLMVYGVSQYDLRKSLQDAEEKIPDQKRKPTDKPSMKWVYFLFSGIHELTISVGKEKKQLVINVNELLKQIISHFGERARSIYLNPA